MDSSEITISVCACTYKRPEGLLKLLTSLGTMQLPADGCRVEVLVVDNDPLASAESYVRSQRAGFPVPLRYVVEPISGVGHARNRAVQEACGQWIAFIDDDEWAEPAWLVELWKLGASGHYDGVFGPVMAVFEQTPPAWVAHNNVFERHRQPTGTAMDWRNCASGNVLFKRSLYQAVGGFDVAFATSGGEDTDFFSRCQLQGARFVWCDEAVSNETVPGSRLTRQWVRRRAVQVSRGYARVAARREGVFKAVDVMFRGAVGLFVFSVMALLAFIARRQSAFRYACLALMGYGKLTAFVSRRSGPYGAAPAREGAPVKEA